MISARFLFVIPIAFIAACAAPVKNFNVEQLDDPSVVLPKLEVGSAVFRDARVEVDNQESIDVSWGGFVPGQWSNLKPYISSSTLSEVVAKYTDVNDQHSGELVLTVRDARQGLVARLTTADRIAWADVEARVTSSGGEKSARGVCYAKETVAFYKRETFKSLFDSAFDCAVRKAIAGESSAEELALDEAAVKELASKLSFEITEPSFTRVSLGGSSENAFVQDSFDSHSNWKVRLFFASEVNGSEIEEHAFQLTRDESYNDRHVYTPAANLIEVPAGTVKLTIHASAHVPMMILSFFSETAYLEKDITFEAEAGETYRVSGVLSRRENRLWIENAAGEIVAE